MPSLPPPPTKYPGKPAQRAAMASQRPGHAPPPTRYGAVALQPSAAAARPAGLPPPPSRYGNGAIQRTEHAPPPPARRPMLVVQRMDFEEDPPLLTRVLNPSQLKRPNIGINTVRTTPGSFRRNLGESVDPSGGGEEFPSRLYSFLRGNGGAGVQGLHKKPTASGLEKIVKKVAEDEGRDYRDDFGKKFAIITVDPSKLDQEMVYDLQDKETVDLYDRHYGKKAKESGKIKRSFRKMYDDIAQENVVVMDGSIPVDAIVSLRAFRFDESIGINQGTQTFGDVLSGVLSPPQTKFQPQPEPVQAIRLRAVQNVTAHTDLAIGNPFGPRYEISENAEIEIRRQHPSDPRYVGVVVLKGAVRSISFAPTVNLGFSVIYVDAAYLNSSTNFSRI